MIISDTVFFRKYTHADRHICCTMMHDTWMYERFFPNMKNPANLYMFMLASYLRESDYTEVAVRVDAHNNEEIVGFLCGQTKPLSFLRKIQNVFFLLRATCMWIFGAYGKRIDIYKLLKKMKQDEHELFADFTSKDAHIHLFFTTDNVRGLGIGKKLLSRFENYCKEKNSPRILLITDTDCNYGFYNYSGFDCVKIQQGCFGVPQTEEEKMQSKTFVYVKNM